MCAGQVMTRAQARRVINPPTENYRGYVKCQQVYNKGYSGKGFDSEEVLEAGPSRD